MIETILQQYIAPMVSWFFALFTPQEWRAFVLLIGVTLAATHTIKIAWRLSPLRGSSHGHLYLVSALVGFLSAPFIWPPELSWWVPAVMAGPVAAIVFKVAFYFLKKLSPGLANVVNIERRQRDIGPPAYGTQTRKTDEGWRR